MKKILVILVLFLLGCANKSEKTNKTDNQVPTSAIMEDSTRENCFDSDVFGEDFYQGYPGYVHILLKKVDNNIYLTRYQQDFTEDEILIDEGFVKYHSDSVGVAIKTEFLSDVLLNYTCIGDTVTCYPSKGVDSMSMAKITWYSSNGSIKGLDSISITFFEDWDVGDCRNVFQSSISYFGKVYYSNFNDPEVNDIIQAITMSSGCSEEMIPFMGYTLEVDSIVDSISSYAVWDIVTLYKKYPLKTCKMKNIEGVGTMLQYHNSKEGDKKLCLTYKNNELIAIILGETGAISKSPYLYLVDRATTERKDGKSIRYSYGN